MLYLTIYGNGDENISLKAAECSNDKLHNVEESFNFEADVIGSRRQPLPLHIGSATKVKVAKDAQPQVWPRSTTDKFNIRFSSHIIGKLTLTHDGTTYNYGYIRVRSNQSADETVGFKIYDRTTQRELPLIYTTTFTADAMDGMPSMPIPLFRRLLGDCDGDGYVTITDVMIAVGYVLGDGNTQLIYENANIDADNSISLTDIMSIVNIILEISD